MNNGSRTLGCIGLSPREATQAKLLLNVLQDRLNGRWRLVDSPSADIVLADPRDEAGRSALASGDTAHRVIAVTERDTEAPAQAGAQLCRPFRSETLVRAINQIERRSAGESGEAGEAREVGLARAIHDAMRGDAGAGVIAIEGLPEGTILLDGPADLVRGPRRALTADRLAADTTCRVRAIDPAESAAIAAGEPQRGAYDLLWSLGEQAVEAGLPVADASATRMRLARWPRQSRLSGSRSRVRAASLLRQRDLALEQLAAASRSSRAALLPMLGAAWLVGDLVISDQASARAAASPAPSAAAGRRRRERPSASLIGRIRNRLGAA